MKRPDIARPFTCSDCPSSFGPDLKRHKGLHLVGEAREKALFQHPAYPTCGVQDFQKSNIVNHVRRRHPELLERICSMCRQSLFFADDIAALMQHQKDAHFIIQAPFEPLSPPPISSTSAVNVATMSTPLTPNSSPSIEEPNVHDPPSPRTHSASSSSPTMTSSLPEELGTLLLHGRPQESQLVDTVPCGSFSWHPRFSSDVPRLSTLYGMLPSKYRDQRPDLFPLRLSPSLHGGVGQGPVAAGNLPPLIIPTTLQTLPTPPPALPTPPPSPPPAARPSSPPKPTLKWPVTSQPLPPTEIKDPRFYVRFIGDNIVSNRYNSEVLPTP